MKGLKCSKICRKKMFLPCCFWLVLLVFLELCVGFFLNTIDASALELTHGGTKSFTSGYIDLYRTDSSNFRQVQATYTDPYLRVTVPVLTPVTQFHLSLSSDIPANSIFVFNVRYKVVSGQSNNFGYMEFNGLSTGSAWTLLNQSCIDLEGLNYGAPAAGSTIVYAEEVTCTYTGFTNVALSHINTLQNNPIVTFKNTNTSTSSSNTDGYIYFSPVSTRQISWNGLTADDRAWLLQNLPSGGATPAQIEQAVVDAQETAREQEQQEVEQAYNDIQGDFEDNQDVEDISQQTTNLLSIISGFITAVSSPQISTCILPVDLRNYTGASFYEVDLCHLSPPSGITNVLNVIFLFFVLALAVSAVRIAISLFNEVTNN